MHDSGENMHPFPSESRNSPFLSFHLHTPPFPLESPPSHTLAPLPLSSIKFAQANFGSPHPYQTLIHTCTCLCNISQDLHEGGRQHNNLRTRWDGHSSTGAFTEDLRSKHTHWTKHTFDSRGSTMWGCFLAADTTDRDCFMWEPWEVPHTISPLRERRGTSSSLSKPYLPLASWGESLSPYLPPSALSPSTVLSSCYGPDSVAVPVQDHHVRGLDSGQVVPAEALHRGDVSGLHQPDSRGGLLRALPGGGAWR